MCLLSYVVFLCFLELVNIKCFDIIFYEDYFFLYIFKIKIDKYKIGSNVIVFKINNVICLYGML